MGWPRFLLLALVAGCVINVGEDDCSKCDNAPRCHSHLDDLTQECTCDPGHQWSNPGNDNDFECEKIPPKPGTSNCIEDFSYMLGDSCYCEVGFKWCSSDPSDLTCCVDEDQATDESGSSGTASGGSAETGEREVELPACDASVEGQLGCTNPDPDRREPTYQCIAAEWVELDEDLYCQTNGLGDFGYGCWLMPNEDPMLPPTPVVECGVGPGSACTEIDRACVDATTLHLCSFGRLTAQPCQDDCTAEQTGTCVDSNCVCM